MNYSFQDFLLQGSEIATLQRQINQRRMVHALLITGDSGFGKRSLAFLLAEALFCSADGNKPCGQCGACLQTLSGEHPDLICIEKGIPLAESSKKGRSTIPVDDIRELIRLSSRYTYEGGNRVVIIADAENMTPQAQNSLLKILEEPPEDTFFLMTTAHPDQLLTTVRSRCRLLRLKPWPLDYIVRKLVSAGYEQDKAAEAAKVSGGSIGRALLLVSDESYWKLRDEITEAFFMTKERSKILSFSNAWKDYRGEAGRIFDILDNTLRDLLQFRLSGQTQPFRANLPEPWNRFAANAGLERFERLFDLILLARKETASNVNFQAVIEQLLLSFIGERELWET